MQAVHVLNTVTVPMGNQIGTDGTGDHTEYGVVYDHVNKTIYWRCTTNQNMQRLRLVDARLTTGAAKAFLALQSPKLPWYPPPSPGEDDRLFMERVWVSTRANPIARGRVVVSTDGSRPPGL